MRIFAWALGCLGALLAAVALLWFGYGLYVRYIVTRSPSTTPMVMTDQGEVRLGSYLGGDQVLPLAAEPPSYPPTDSPGSASQGIEHTVSATPTVISATVTAVPFRPVLPPTRLRIAKIGVNVPVTLADNDNLPRFKAAGWYIGTGYPGFRGNVVLFGHLNGEFETFARLNEVVAGDELVVEALERRYRYIAAETKVVPADTVSALAPTGDSRLTLITCTGTFYPATRDYSHRLLVIGTLADEQ